MEKKITQKDMFNEVIALATANGREDIVKFAEERIAALDKKSASHQRIRQLMRKSKLKSLSSSKAQKVTLVPKSKMVFPVTTHSIRLSHL